MPSRCHPEARWLGVCMANVGDSKPEGVTTESRRHGGTERGGGELDRMTGLTGCCGFILFLLFILSDTSKGLPRRGGNSLMKKQTRMSAPLLNLEAGQMFLTVSLLSSLFSLPSSLFPLPSSLFPLPSSLFPLPSSLFSVPLCLRGESLPLPDFCDAYTCQWGVRPESRWLFAGAVPVSHTKAQRREEGKKSGFRAGPFAPPRLRVRPVDR